MWNVNFSVFDIYFCTQTKTNTPQAIVGSFKSILCKANALFLFSPRQISRISKSSDNGNENSQVNEENPK